MSPDPPRNACECWCASAILLVDGSLPFGAGDVRTELYYFEKIRVFKAGICLEYISME